MAKKIGGLAGVVLGLSAVAAMHAEAQQPSVVECTTRESIGISYGSSRTMVAQYRHESGIRMVFYDAVSVPAQRLTNLSAEEEAIKFLSEHRPTLIEIYEPINPNNPRNLSAIIRNLGYSIDDESIVLIDLKRPGDSCYESLKVTPWNPELPFVILKILHSERMRNGK